VKCRRTIGLRARLAYADKILSDNLLSRIDNLDGFADRCRGEALALAATEPSELCVVRSGQRIGPDRRSWEIKFRGLASWLTRSAVRLRLDVQKRQAVRSCASSRVARTRPKTRQRKKEDRQGAGGKSQGARRIVHDGRHRKIVRRQNAIWRALPEHARARTAALPFARRGTGFRRAERQSERLSAWLF